MPLTVELLAGDRRDSARSFNFFPENLDGISLHSIYVVLGEALFGEPSDFLVEMRWTCPTSQACFSLSVMAASVLVRF